MWSSCCDRAANDEIHFADDFTAGKGSGRDRTVEHDLGHNYGEHGTTGQRLDDKPHGFA